MGGVAAGGGEGRQCECQQQGPALVSSGPAGAGRLGVQRDPGRQQEGDTHQSEQGGSGHHAAAPLGCQARPGGGERQGDGQQRHRLQGERGDRQRHFHVNCPDPPQRRDPPGGGGRQQQRHPQRPAQQQRPGHALGGGLAGIVEQEGVAQRTHGHGDPQPPHQDVGRRGQPRAHGEREQAEAHDERGQRRPPADRAGGRDQQGRDEAQLAADPSGWHQHDGPPGPSVSGPSGPPGGGWTPRSWPSRSTVVSGRVSRSQLPSTTWAT